MTSTWVVTADQLSRECVLSILFKVSILTLLSVNGDGQVHIWNYLFLLFFFDFLQSDTAKLGVCDRSVSSSG